LSSRGARNAERWSIWAAPFRTATPAPLPAVNDGLQLGFPAAAAGWAVAAPMATTSTGNSIRMVGLRGVAV
jgi:hypothetical protein